MSSSEAASLAVTTVYTTFFMLCSVVWAVVCVIAMWKMFVKAGVPGWASIVPFYNMYCLYKISMGIGWLFLLSLVPCFGVIMAIIMELKLASAFGKGVGFGIGLIFLNPIFMLILGFGSDEYVGVR